MTILFCVVPRFITSATLVPSVFGMNLIHFSMIQLNLSNMNTFKFLVWLFVFRFCYSTGQKSLVSL